MSEAVRDPSLDAHAHTEPETVPTKRFDGFDGLRAVAAVLVLLHHASYPSGRMYVGHYARQFTQLDVGVAIFFLISGFLLYRPFAFRILTGAPEPGVVKFLLRRAARIFPAYWIALTAIIAVGKITDGRLLGLAQYPKSVMGYLPYYTLTHIYRNFDEARGGLNQAWTLAVEITFYLFLPLYAWLIRRSSREASAQNRFRIQIAGVVALFAVSVAFRSFGYWGPAGRVQQLGEYWIFANLDLFACGMLLAVLSVGYDLGLAPRRIIDRVADVGELWWVLAVVVFWVASNALPVGLNTRPTKWAGLYKQEFHALVALLLLVPVVFAHRRVTLITKLLRQRVVVFMGVVSYGIYLWHQSWIVQAVRWQYRPVFTADMLLLVVFAVAVSTATASISWFCFERPIVRRFSR